MTYVDGFLLPVPKKNLAEYRRLARQGGKIWIDHGALEFRECVADDLTMQTPAGPTKSLFPRMVGLKRGETVMFSYIVFRSRAHRDRVNAKVMKDPRLAGMDMAKLPFDFARMAYGGFKALVEL